MISWNLDPAQCNYFNRNVEMLISTQYIAFLLTSYLPPLLFQCQEFVQDSFVGLSVSVHGGGWNKIKIVYLKIRSIYHYSNNDFIFSANMGRWIKMSKVLFKYSISATVLTIDYPTPSTLKLYNSCVKMLSCPCQDVRCQNVLLMNCSYWFPGVFLIISTQFSINNQDPSIGNPPKRKADGIRTKVIL